MGLDVPNVSADCSVGVEVEIGLLAILTARSCLTLLAGQASTLIQDYTNIVNVILVVKERVYLVYEARSSCQTPATPNFLQWLIWLCFLT